MRNKMITALVLIGLVAVLASYFFLFEGEDVLDPVFGEPTGEKITVVGSDLNIKPGTDIPSGEMVNAEWLNKNGAAQK
jgi:hypothetical protein